MKEIQLTQGKVALVNDEDFDQVNQFKWRALFNCGNWYVIRSLPRDGTCNSKNQYLHQFLVPGHAAIDHIDTNGLNNQRANLRPATGSQNNANRRKQPGFSSCFKGVSWYNREQKWVARIKFQRRSLYLGSYQSEKDAAISYNAAARAYFGEFARLNLV